MTRWPIRLALGGGALATAGAGVLLWARWGADVWLNAALTFCL